MKPTTTTLSSLQKLHILWNVLRHPRTSPIAKFLLGGSLLYGILPFDFIPDFLPLIGITDDATLLIAGIMVFMKMTKAMRKEIEKNIS